MKLKNRLSESDFDKFEMDREFVIQVHKYQLSGYEEILKKIQAEDLINITSD